ncbi:fumarylacetoacetate hydrolase family protein [Thermodesulfobacterium hydrogeniphilum]|uniref:fumarylacetoacetate hydrolase family protein n=1 Tax=Thermodesulfobacterium hydrogeniphilum TaxID=161156 RepID=UPI000570C0B4|nr:fumarylacetoacetate hydrolase family protein [Thermodesulfobacterium hydrogeniphilum]
MKIGRFLVENKVIYGIIKNSEIFEIKSPFEKLELTGKIYSLEEVKVLSPVLPSKIIAVGLNYKNHAEELKMKLPEEPILFLKPSSAVIGPEEDIILPPESKEVHYEGELAVVIGKNIYRPNNFKKVEEAILGYTCFNDVTARDLQRKDGQWTRSKSFNTFAPIGPFIETEVDPNNLKIETKVNGKIKQSSSTKELIFDVFYLVKFISNIMTLYPGDVIATGTPPGVGELKEGDIVEISIENVGVLKNFVKRF